MGRVEGEEDGAGVGGGGESVIVIGKGWDGSSSIKV